jgi:hypothetical protein
MLPRGGMCLAELLALPGSEGASAKRTRHRAKLCRKVP